MSCYHSAILNAPVEAVWSAISNFHDMSWAPEVITSLEVKGDVSGDEVGAVRLLNGLFLETLREVNADGYNFTYSIDDGPDVIAKEVVANYLGTVALTPVTIGDQTLIEWSSVYDSDDENAVAEFCNPIYVALLTAMQQHFA